MAALVGVVLFPGSNCELDAVEADRGARRAGRAALARRRARVGQRRRGRSSPAGSPTATTSARRHRPLLARSWTPCASSPPPAARSSGSATASRCSPRPACSPAPCRRTAGLKFLCTTAALRVETTDSALTAEAAVGDVLRIPINHFEGNYTCDADTLAELRAEDRVVLRYVDNPNGSVDDIAGICNEGATSSASCRTRSGRATRCSARPTARCCCARCSCAPARPSPDGSAARRPMPARLSTAGSTPELAPRGVGDALALCCRRRPRRRSPARGR